MKLFLFLFFSLCIISALLIFFGIPFFQPYQQTTLKAFHWEKEPGIIALQNNREQGKEYTALVRIKDGKEQPLPGRWTVQFSNYGNTFVFGEYQIEKDKKPINKLFYVEKGRKISDIDVNGPIFFVDENPKQTYLVIKSQAGSLTLYCILERIGTRREGCKQLEIKGITSVLWNPNKEHELVVKTSDNGIIIYDPWEGEPRRLLRSEDKLLREELLRLFAQEKNKESNTIYSREGKKVLFHRFLTVLLVREDKKMAVYHIPLLAKVSWLFDSKHILVKDKNALKIIELSTKTMATLFPSDQIRNFTIKWRNTNYDIVF